MEKPETQGKDGYTTLDEGYTSLEVRIWPLNADNQYRIEAMVDGEGDTEGDHLPGHEVSTWVSEVIRKGLCFGQTELQGQNGWGCHTITRLGNMEAGLNRFWRNAYMREVSLPQQIEEMHLLRAERAKLNEYRTAVQVYRRYVDAVLWPSEAKIKDIGRRILPVPARLDSTAGPWLELGADILRS